MNGSEAGAEARRGCRSLEPMATREKIVPIYVECSHSGLIGAGPTDMTGDERPYCYTDW